MPFIDEEARLRAMARRNLQQPRAGLNVAAIARYEQAGGGPQSTSAGTTATRISILPVLDAAGRPRDDLLRAWAGHPARVVASAARVGGGPEWVVVAIGGPGGHVLTDDVRTGLVEVGRCSAGGAA